MPPRLTRSKSSKGSKGPKPEEDAPTSQTTTKKSLETAEDIHRVCILPKDVSRNADIIYLPHPSTSAPAAFLFSPDNGQIHELTKVSAPRKLARSWLIARDEETVASTEGVSSLQQGYVIEDADMLVATPFDPLFFLLSLVPTCRSKDKSSFRLADDYWEILSEQSAVLARLTRNVAFAKILLKRLEIISDVQEIGDDKVYRPSQVGLARVLAKKACRMIGKDTWPKSMDEGLVKKELEIPLLQRQQQDVDEEKVDGSGTENEVNASNTSKPKEPQQHLQLDPAVLDRMRIRKALDYLLSAYVPQSLKSDIEAVFQQDELRSTTNLLDMSILNDHLEKVKEAKSEAVALRALSDNISRKRGMDDEETTDARAEKKRKKDEEEQKKKNESRALKNLKKVDTSGMKKMSSFFTKLPAKKEQPA